MTSGDPTTMAYAILTQTIRGGERLRPFEREHLLDVSAEHGIYWIMLASGKKIVYPRRESSILYAGKAKNLRARLLQHRGGGSSGNRWIRAYIEQGHALAFSYTCMVQKTVGERLLLDQFIAELGMRPLCNSRLGDRKAAADQSPPPMPR